MQQLSDMIQSKATISQDQPRRFFFSRIVMISLKKIKKLSTGASKFFIVRRKLLVISGNVNFFPPHRKQASFVKKVL